MILFALAAAAQLPAPRPAEVKTFGDWSVACDNGRRCQAISLQPKGSMDEAATMILMTRAADPRGPLTIAIEVRAVGADSAVGTRPATVTIDGTIVGRATLGRDDQWLVASADTVRVATAMANGRALTLAVANGVSTPASLAGASAMLRYIDAEQRRTGTVTALVAKGPKPATSVAAPPALPGVRSLVTTRQPARLAPALEARLRAQSECTEDEGERARHEVNALDATTDVIQLSCGNGAYNFTSAVFIRKGPTATPAPFDVPPSGGEGAIPLMVNTGFEPKTGILSGFSKGRGIGDCGVSESYVWDGNRFRLIEATRMEECRGASEWLTIWRATPLRRR